MAQAKPKSVIIQETRDLLGSLKGEFKSALGATMAPEKLVRVVMTAVQNNSQLRQCCAENPVSVLRAVMEGAQRNLIPDGVRAALIPFRNRGTLVCQLVPMYQGLLNLVWMSGQVAGVSCEVVHKNDTFEYDLGEGWVRHRKYEGEDRPDDSPGPLRFAYCVFRTLGGDRVVTVLTRREVMEHKSRSRSAQKGDGPWMTDEAAMWRKTAIKVNCKKAPFSEDLRRAVQLDDQTETGLEQDLPTVEIPYEEKEPPETFSEIDDAIGAIAAAETPERVDEIYTTFMESIGPEVPADEVSRVTVCRATRKKELSEGAKQNG